MKEMRTVRIHIVGGDQWALGTEYQLARKCLGTFATLVDAPQDADFLHTVDVEDTASRIYKGELRPLLPIVGAINNHPSRLVEWPGFVEVARRWMYLVPQTTIAATDMARLGLDYAGKARIITDSESYHPIAEDDERLQNLRRQLKIPQDTYLIGLLQRDSEGRDVTIAKRQKGPDIFLALLVLLQQRLGSNAFHVLLGGPRRHWLRTALDRHKIPYSFMGRLVSGDDYPENILDKKTMCLLYNLLDLYVIPTRWEGAPRQIFDVLECGRKIISTPVGIVPDVLSPECIYRSLQQGVELIEKDIASDFLKQFVACGRSKVQDCHGVEAVGKLWKQVYEDLLEEERQHSIIVQGLSRPGGTSRAVSQIVKRVQAVANNVLPIQGVYRRWRPQRITLCAGTLSGRRALERLGNDLRALHLAASWEDGYGETVLVWGMADAGSPPVSTAEKCVLILDDVCCNKLLLTEDVDLVTLQPLLEKADTTIIPDHETLGRLTAAGRVIHNPVVVAAWRYAFDEYAKACTAEKKCAVLIDSRGSELCPVAGLQEVLPEDFFLLDLGEDEWLNSGMEKWQKVLREFDLAVILAADLDPKLLKVLMAARLVCVYPEQFARFNDSLGFMGICCDDRETMKEAIRQVLAGSSSYREILSLPYREDIAGTIAQIARQPRAA